MNIVILTGLYPTEDSPSGGLFIYERLKELQKTKNQFQVYAISRRYSIGISIQISSEYRIKKSQNCSVG